VQLGVIRALDPARFPEPAQIMRHPGAVASRLAGRPEQLTLAKENVNHPDLRELPYSRTRAVVIGGSHRVGWRTRFYLASEDMG
jgi:hypothetical protein